jgi:sec-independent protein translocase protein TatC
MATKAEPSELQGHMTLMEHIAELRTRLVRSIIAVAIGAVIAWFLYDELLHFLLGPLR